MKNYAMARNRPATESADDELSVETHGTPRTPTTSTLLSLPLEVRLMIFAACIVPCWVKTGGGLPNYGDEPRWYLSHTIPRSALYLSKQLRTDAFTALAGYPSLAVICNSWPDYSPKNDAYSPTLENMIAVGEDTLHDFQRVYRQCESLPSPKGRKLTLRLFDAYGRPVLEDVKPRVVDQVSVAVKFWPFWESVLIDVDAMGGLILNQRKDWGSDYGARLERGWRMVVEELQPLRARTTTMTVGLKGCPVDCVLKELEKGESSGPL